MTECGPAETGQRCKTDAHLPAPDKAGRGHSSTTPRYIPADASPNLPDADLPVVSCPPSRPIEPGPGSGGGSSGARRRLWDWRRRPGCWGPGSGRGGGLPASLARPACWRDTWLPCAPAGWRVGGGCGSPGPGSVAPGGPPESARKDEILPACVIVGGEDLRSPGEPAIPPRRSRTLQRPQTAPSREVLERSLLVLWPRWFDSRTTKCAIVVPRMAARFEQQ